MLYLKKSNLVHRDFKSPNVLLDANYIPKICDFGLAKLKLNSATHTKTSIPVGTIRWMAPELFQGKPHSFASDVYALGLVIWEVLTEKLPYADASDFVVAHFIMSGAQEEIPTDTSKVYSSIIKNCWHRDPKHRLTVEEINEIHDDALPQVDTSDELDIESCPSVVNPDFYSTQTASQQQSLPISSISDQVVPKVPEPKDYATILSRYLLETTTAFIDEDRLVLILHTHSESFKQWIEAEAKQGNNDAAIVLGEMYYHGCGVPKDDNVAFEQFYMVANKESSLTNARAQLYLGRMYYYGVGVPKSDDKAEEWFSKAIELYTKFAEQGDVRAQRQLGVAYNDGLYELRHFGKAIEWYTKAAEQGDIVAQFRLGKMYEKLDEDYERVIEWYAKAAEQGHAAAQYNLGWMYQKGRGVPQSDEKAIEWYMKAAEQGHATAQNNLGWMYKEGRWVPQSDDKAVEWLTKAAEQGDTDAQNILGRIYDNGGGIPQSDGNAVKTDV